MVHVVCSTCRFVTQLASPEAAASTLCRRCFSSLAGMPGQAPKVREPGLPPLPSRPESTAGWTSVRSGLLGLRRFLVFIFVALGVGALALIPGVFVAIIWAMHVGGRPRASTSSTGFVVDALLGLVSLSLLTWVSAQLYRLTRVPEKKLRAWAWLAAGATLAQLPLVAASAVTGADTPLHLAALPLRLAAGVGLALFLFQLSQTLRVSSAPRLGLTLALGPLILQSHIIATGPPVVLALAALAFLAGLFILFFDLQRLANALGPERSPGPGAPNRTILGA